MSDCWRKALYLNSVTACRETDAGNREADPGPIRRMLGPASTRDMGRANVWSMWAGNICSGGKKSAGVREVNAAEAVRSI